MERQICFYFIASQSTGRRTFGRQVSVRSLDRNVPNPEFPYEDVLLDQHSGFVEGYCDRVELR